IWDRGIVDQPSDTWCGVIGAASGGPRLLPDADCILMAGAAADYRVNYINTTAPVLHMDRGFRNIRCDREYREWLSEARRRHVEFRRSVEERGAGQAAKSTHAIHVLAGLREVLTPEAVLLIDGGSIGQWAHQLLCGERYPGHWLTCGRSGVVGYGIAGAMAARLAYPDRPVILLSGDGAFTFNVAELECAVRQRLPFVALVADDQAWGITRTGHLRQFGEAIGSALGPIAFDRLAESLGARGVGARRPEDIAPALREALGAGTVTVIHGPVSGGNPS
ncbi:MAG: thiamine pyrophosphate-binding protein, partial [Acidobacteria bacterium]|nr:thiamine pyrophosphate-binding protein [Acidobacteriota bacterium]